MKKPRLASKSGQSTTGGRLPRWRGALFNCRHVLPVRRHEPAIGSESEIPAPNWAAKIAEANVSVILHEAVLEHFRSECDPNGALGGRPEIQMPGASSSVVASEFPGNSSGSIFFRENGGAAAAPLLFEIRLPRWKRVVDLGILVCTVWLWLPLMALVMGLVKVASPGPAFYRQCRIGFRGKEFMIFKFRSMHLNADTRAHEEYVEHLMEKDSPMTKLDSSDRRLIPCGRFLRATGLDELPQVFNILRGDMSLVGPRPCTVVEFQRYRPEHRARVNAPPGLTGFWQVNGKNRTTFNEMIAMDIFYAENMSLLLDLSIIWKTLPAIVRQTRESSAAARARSGRASVDTIAHAPSNFERLPDKI